MAAKNPQQDAGYATRDNTALAALVVAVMPVLDSPLAVWRIERIEFPVVSLPPNSDSRLPGATVCAVVFTLVCCETRYCSASRFTVAGF